VAAAEATAIRNLGEQGHSDPWRVVALREPFHRRSGRRRQPDFEEHRLRVQLGLQFLESNRPPLAQGLAGRIEIESILESFEKFQVLDGDERGHPLPATLEDDAFASIGNSIQRLRELVTGRGGGHPIHGRPPIRFVRYVRCVQDGGS
jgi:hypothetical protein